MPRPGVEITTDSAGPAPDEFKPGLIHATRDQSNLPDVRICAFEINRVSAYSHCQMKLPRLLLFLLAWPALILAAESSAVKKGAVEATLVSDTAAIEPGKPFTVALRLRHDPHWHSYWIAPGTGYATLAHLDAAPTGSRPATSSGPPRMS